MSGHRHLGSRRLQHRPRRSHRRVAFYDPSVSTASSSPSSVIAPSTGFRSLHRAVRPDRPRLPRPRAHAAGDARLRTFPAPSGGVLDASPAAPLTRQTLTPLPCLCACCELNFGRRHLTGSPSSVLRCFDSSPPRQTNVGSSTSRLPPSPTRPRRSHRRVAFYAPSVSTASSSPSSVIALSTGFPAVPPGRSSSPTGNHCNFDS